MVLCCYGRVGIVVWFLRKKVSIIKYRGFLKYYSFIELVNFEENFILWFVIGFIIYFIKLEFRRLNIFRSFLSFF